MLFPRRLEEVQKYLLPSSENNCRSTPSSHNKYIWLHASRGVKAERSLVKLAWATNCREFEYSRPGVEKFHVSFQALQDMVHTTENMLLNAFDSLLPSTFDGNAVAQLPWDTLHDDGSKPESFIDAEGTWNEWLGPAVTKLKLAYLDSAETRHRLTADSDAGRASFSAFNKLLELDTKFQEALVGELVSAAGISPRIGTLQDYRFRADSEGVRNLFLVLEAVVIEGGKQKAEWSRNGERELVIRALTPRAGICLVRYLALVRLALVEIMVENRWHSNVVNTYKTHLFARPARKKEAKGLWQPCQIAAAWHAISAPFLKAKTSIVDVRQYGSGIYDKLFPILLGAPEESAEIAVDRLGDHKKKIRVNHYGRSDALCNGHSEPDTRDFILACRVWQSAMRAFPVDRSWPESIVRSVLLTYGQ